MSPSPNRERGRELVTLTSAASLGEPVVVDPAAVAKVCMFVSERHPNANTIIVGVKGKMGNVLVQEAVEDVASALGLQPEEEAVVVEDLAAPLQIPAEAGAPNPADRSASSEPANPDAEGGEVDSALASMPHALNSGAPSPAPVTAAQVRSDLVDAQARREEANPLPDPRRRLPSIGKPKDEPAPEKTASKRRPTHRR